MTDNSTRDSPPAQSGRRRSSFVDLFTPRPSTQTTTTTPRRLSITTLGLSTIPTPAQTPYTNMRARAESVSSANSGSVDESPFEDDPPPSAMSPVQQSQNGFNRRMSFGAKAMRDGRGSGSGSGTSPVGVNGGPVQSGNEGFDFAENMRVRAQRGSISGSTFAMPNLQLQQQQQQREQAHRKSIATMEPPRELPKQMKAPDAFQERILKGDFYMD